MGRNSRRRKRAALREQHDRRRTTGAQPDVTTARSIPADDEAAEADEDPFEGLDRGLLLVMGLLASCDGASMEFEHEGGPGVDPVVWSIGVPHGEQAIPLAVDRVMRVALSGALDRGWLLSDIADVVDREVSGWAAFLVRANGSDVRDASASRRTPFSWCSGVAPRPWEEALFDAADAIVTIGRLPDRRRPLGESR